MGGKHFQMSNFQMLFMIISNQLEKKQTQNMTGLPASGIRGVAADSFPPTPTGGEHSRRAPGLGAYRSGQSVSCSPSSTRGSPEAFTQQTLGAVFLVSSIGDTAVSRVDKLVWFWGSLWVWEGGRCILNKETVSSKSMIGARKRTEQSQDGEGPTCNLTKTATWQAQLKDLNMWIGYGKWRRKPSGRGSSRCNGLRV